MKGSVKKDGNRWYVVVDLPRRADGKRRQKWHGGFATKREAETAQASIVSDLGRGAYVEATKETAGRYLDLWLVAKRGSLRASTLAAYEMHVKTHIKPALGHHTLQTLGPQHLDTLYADLLATGGKNGTGLAPTSVRKVHAIIRKALADAQRKGLVQRNVADAADPPRAPRTERETWTAADAQRFLAHVRDDRLYPLFALALTTGMRRGELLGLRWSDVDLDAGYLSVTRSLTVVGGYEPQFSEPKTARGRRRVDLDNGTTAILRAHRKQQVAERLQSGSAYDDMDLLFTSADGSALHPDSISSMFERRAKAAGVPAISFHDLRHTYATIALQAGEHPKVVQERLGHASIAITLDTYSHVAPTLHREAATRVAALVLNG